MPKALQPTEMDIAALGPQGILLATAIGEWGSRARTHEQNLLEWINYGIGLARVERLILWELGDWYNRFNPAWGDRAAIMSAPEWTGPSYKTCRNYAVVARRFPIERRRHGVSFAVHAEFAALEDAQAEERLRVIENGVEETGQSPTREHVRQDLKRERRLQREADLAEATERASLSIGHDLYGVILADPPWRFEVYSQETGMDRAADNHYPTMSLEKICALEVPAADDAVLFLWRTQPMSEPGLQVMKAWGFKSISEWIWGKDRAGTGYWGRNRHEVLMIGTRGSPVAPAMGLQPESLILAPVGEHSAKPSIFHEIIEAMFPRARKLEMFARSQRPGWDFFGNETNSRRAA